MYVQGYKRTEDIERGTGGRRNGGTDHVHQSVLIPLDDSSSPGGIEERIQKRSMHITNTIYTSVKAFSTFSCVVITKQVCGRVESSNN